MMLKIGHYAPVRRQSVRRSAVLGGAAIAIGGATCALGLTRAHRDWFGAVVGAGFVVAGFFMLVTRDSEVGGPSDRLLAPREALRACLKPGQISRKRRAYVAAGFVIWVGDLFALALAASRHSWATVVTLAIISAAFVFVAWAFVSGWIEESPTTP
jgi:hypothetical protein